MLKFVLSFPAGVTGVLPTEIFNQTARPAAYMIAGSMMWLNLFITGMIFPFLVVSVHLGMRLTQINNAQVLLNGASPLRDVKKGES